MLRIDPNKIRQWMKTRGMNQSEVARASGVSPSRVSMILGTDPGREPEKARDYQISTLGKLVAALDYRADDLLTEYDEIQLDTANTAAAAPAAE